MSLINDALKKAQKQRNGNGPELNTLPSIGGEPAARIAKRGKPAGFNSLVTWIGVGVVALVVLCVGGFFLVRWMTNSPSTAISPQSAIVAQTTPAPAEPAPAVTSNNAAPLPATSAPVKVAVTPPAIETKPVAITPPPEPEPPKPAAPALKMEPKAVTYIEALRVAGIRASATDSKVLMNDRVYRTGDTVEHQLGLKLAVITPDSLTFEDERGVRYTRNF